MVIFQDSCKTDGYLARSCKILEENLQEDVSSCKILQDSCKTDGYLARSCKILEENLTRRCIVLQDFARFLQDGWLSGKILARRIVILHDSRKTDGYLARSCKFLEENLQEGVSSCKILQDSCKILQDNNSDPTWVHMKDLRL